MITDVATGFKRELSGKGRDGKYWHTVTERSEARRPRRPCRPRSLRDRARERARSRVALPSPYMLSVRMWEEGVSRAVYPTREAFADAIVPILRAQVTGARRRRRAHRADRRPAPVPLRRQRDTCKVQGCRRRGHALREPHQPRLRGRHGNEARGPPVPSQQGSSRLGRRGLVRRDHARAARALASIS